MEQSRTRRALLLAIFLAILGVATLLLAELGARLVMAARLGPSVLAHGTGLERGRPLRGPLADAPWYVRTAHVERIQRTRTAPGGDTYLKYRPHQTRFLVDVEGRRVQASINAQGFRGPEFTTEKPPGLLRVVAVGASSTFGYHDGDDETWPHYLQQRLDGAFAVRPLPGGARVEVLNLGIPHLDARQIAALLEAEGFALQPDVVVFYEGANESRDIARTPLELGLQRLGRRLVLGALLEHGLAKRLERFSEERIARAAEELRGRFLESLDRIATGCAERRVDLIVATQQARSMRVPREALAQLRYAEEQALIQAELAREGHLDLEAASFVLHGLFMQDLRDWAASRPDVVLADTARALDAAGARDALVSWVHLGPKGNRVLAEALESPVRTLLVARIETREAALPPGP